MQYEEATSHIGKIVQVSDGTPMPPQHHKKKLKTWRQRNYTGVLKEVKSDTRFGGPRAGVLVSSSPYMTITNMEPLERVSLVDKQEAQPCT